MVNLKDGLEKSVGVHTFEFDRLVHVYCVHIESLGLCLAFDVSRWLGWRGVFLSLKACNSLLSSLVMAGELQRSYEAYELCQGLQPDVFICKTAINLWRVKDVVGLFLEREKLGVCSNVVTYNSIIHGIRVCEDLQEAFLYKKKMVQSQIS